MHSCTGLRVSPLSCEVLSLFPTNSSFIFHIALVPNKHSGNLCQTANKCQLRNGGLVNLLIQHHMYMLNCACIVPARPLTSLLSLTLVTCSLMSDTSLKEAWDVMEYTRTKPCPFFMYRSRIAVNWSCTCDHIHILTNEIYSSIAKLSCCSMHGCMCTDMRTCTNKYEL